MNPQQTSTTAAFTLVAAALAVRHHWLSRLSTWAGKPPASSGPAASLAPAGTVNDWQAAILAYAILLLVGETAARDLAPALAWAIGLLELLGVTGTLKTEYPGLFTGTRAASPSAAPATPAGGSAGGST
jgi:hypothetical protein